MSKLLTGNVLLYTLANHVVIDFRQCSVIFIL